MSNILPTFTTPSDSLPFNTLFNQVNSKLGKPLTKELFGSLVEEGSVVYEGSTLTLSELEFSPLIPALGYVALAYTLYNTLDDIHLEQYFHFGSTNRLSNNAKSPITKILVQNTMYSASNEATLTKEEVSQVFDKFYNPYLGILYKHHMSKTKSDDIKLERHYLFNYEYHIKPKSDTVPCIFAGEYYNNQYARVSSIDLFRESDTFSDKCILKIALIQPSTETNVFNLSIPYQPDDDSDELYNKLKSLLDENNLTEINKFISDRLGLHLYNLSPIYEPSDKGISKLNSEVDKFITDLEQSYHDKYFQEEVNQLVIPTLPLNNLVFFHNSRPLMFANDYQTLVYQDTLEPYTGSLTNLTLQIVEATPLDSISWSEFGVLYSWDWSNGKSPTTKSGVIPELKGLALTSEQVQAIQDSLEDKNGRLYTPVDLFEDEYVKPSYGTLIGYLKQPETNTFNGGHTVRKHIAKTKDFMKKIAEKSNRISTVTVGSTDFLPKLVAGIVEVCTQVNKVLNGKSSLPFTEFSPSFKEFTTSFGLEDLTNKVVNNNSLTVITPLTLVEQDNSCYKDVEIHFYTSQNLFMEFKKYTENSDRNFRLNTAYPTDKQVHPLQDFNGYRQDLNTRKDTITDLRSAYRLDKQQKALLDIEARILYDLKYDKRYETWWSKYFISNPNFKNVEPFVLVVEAYGDDNLGEGNVSQEKLLTEYNNSEWIRDFMALNTLLGYSKGMLVGLNLKPLMIKLSNLMRDNPILVHECLRYSFYGGYSGEDFLEEDYDFLHDLLDLDSNMSNDYNQLYSFYMFGASDNLIYRKDSNIVKSLFGTFLPNYIKDLEPFGEYETGCYITQANTDSEGVVKLKEYENIHELIFDEEYEHVDFRKHDWYIIPELQKDTYDKIKNVEFLIHKNRTV